MPQRTWPPGRRYRELAQRLIADICRGTHAEGGRLPAERDLALHYGVSRGAVREAVIALEVLGIVEVRLGSGAHILRSGERRESSRHRLSALDITEALLMIEGEAAALAAREIRSDEIDEIDHLLRRLAGPGVDIQEVQAVDREFHLAVASASRNRAIFEMIAGLMDWRTSSFEASHHYEQALASRTGTGEYTAVLDAFRRADAPGARAAIRAHLSSLLHDLLLIAEEIAVVGARHAAAAQRSRYISAGIFHL